MSQRLIIKNLIVFLLVFLWVYAAASKAMDLKMFKVEMSRQALPLFLKESLVYVLPPLELLTAFMLLFDKTLKWGLYLSAILMIGFSIYVSLAVFNILEKVPCSCGGILASMSWDVHLVFNIVFLLFTVIGIYTVHRERRANAL